MPPQPGSPRSHAPIVGLTLLIAANVVVTVVCLSPPRWAWRDWIGEAGALLLVAQVLLLAMWLAFSDLHAGFRWPIGIAIFWLLFVAIDRYAGWVAPHRSDNWLEPGIMAAIALLAVHAMALPLRWLCGWRLTFHQAPVLETRRGQFTLQNWFSWCIALVLPLALLSVSPGDTATGAIYLLLMLLFFAPLMASALTAAFSRRWWLWSLVAIGWTVPVGWLIAEVYWQYQLSKGQGYAGYHELILHFWLLKPSGLTAAMLVNLLALRVLGMRWVGAADAKPLATPPQRVELQSAGI